MPASEKDMEMPASKNCDFYAFVFGPACIAEEMPASTKEIPARITEEMPASANSNPAAAKPRTAVDWEATEARRRLQRISANFYKDKLVHVPKIQR